MPKQYGQFDQGEGQKYAPKPRAKAGKPAEPFADPKVTKPSVEDTLRDTYMDESHLVNPRAQSTDHMN